MFNLFSEHASTGNISRAWYKKCLPLSGLNNKGPFEVAAEASGNKFFDLPKTRVIIKFKVMKMVNGTEKDLDKSDSVSMCNLAPDAMFEDISVSVNDQRLKSNSSNAHGYKALTDIALSYFPNAKSGHLKSTLWYPDTLPIDQNSIETAKAVNEKKTKKSVNLKIILVSSIDIIF